MRFLGEPKWKKVAPLSWVPCRDSGFSLGSLPALSVLIENVIFACCRIARSRHIILFAVCKKKKLPRVVGGQRPMSEHSREAGRQLGRIKRSVPLVSLFASINGVNDKLRGVLLSYSCQCPTDQPHKPAEHVELQVLRHGWRSALLVLFTIAVCQRFWQHVMQWFFWETEMRNVSKGHVMPVSICPYLCQNVWCRRYEPLPHLLFLHTAPSYLSTFNDSNASSSFLSTFSNPNFTHCSKSSTSRLVFLTFTCTNFLFLVPLSCLVLINGIRQRQRASAATTISNCDLLTNILALELIHLLACVMYCFGIYTSQYGLMKMGISVVYLVYHARLLFHCLTCVEQYVAVMHPLTYLNLKTERGVLARNTVIAFVWLVSLLNLCFSYLYSDNIPMLPYLLLCAAGLTVISYCSLSVLRALARPGLSEVSGNRRKVDKVKKRAYVTIAAIAGAMYVKYIGTVTCMAVHTSPVLGYTKECMVLMLLFWFCVPSSICTPLLFLYRQGKIPCLRAWGGGGRERG